MKAFHWLCGGSLLIAATLGFNAISPANAQLALTPAGIADGFNLSTVITGIPSTGYCCGPLGAATNTSGQIVLQVYQHNNYVFKDMDNQTFANALSSASPPVTTTGYGMAITNDNGVLYTGNNDANGVLQILNSDGSLNSTVATNPATGVAGHGIWTNPVSHHIETASYNGLWDINPGTGAATQINTYGGFDGVSVSVDGKTIYAAANGYIYGYDIASTNSVYQSPYIGSPDGTGVIYGSSAFAGDIIANGNDGNVWLLDPNGLLPDGNAYELIATGGSRGDYVGVELDERLSVPQPNGSGSSPDLRRGLRLCSERSPDVHLGHDGRGLRGRWADGLLGRPPPRGGGNRLTPTRETMLRSRRKAASFLLACSAHVFTSVAT